MTRIEFLKRNFLKYAATLALLGLIVFVVSHAVNNTVGSLLTIPVRQVTDTQITAARAYLFRDEEVLRTAQTGLVDELVESGVKVGKNVPIANVCAPGAQSGEPEAAQKELDALNRALRILKKSEPGIGTPLTQAEEFRAQATQCYLQIRNMIVEGSFSRLSELEDALLVQLNRYMVLTGRTQELDPLIAALEERKAALLGEVRTTVKSERSSGVFYNAGYVDGYESIFTLSALEALDADGFSALCAAEPTPTDATQCTVGKMVYGYVWYLVMETDAEVAALFEAEGRYEVSFPENEDVSLFVTLERTVEAGEKALMILRAEESPASFIYYRSQTVHVSVGSAEGFYIPETALQTLDGVEGVFILEESTVRFRRIGILYRGDGYCIVALPQDSDLTEIKQNDVLITSGKNLYDGKVYQ